MSADTIPGTSDARVANSPMRHAYRVLTEAEKAQVAAIKDTGDEFLALLDTIGGSREIALARTKIEEAVFSAVKHVTA